MKSSSALMTIWFQVGNQRHRKCGRTFCSTDATTADSASQRSEHDPWSYIKVREPNVTAGMAQLEAEIPKAEMVQ